MLFSTALRVVFNLKGGRKWNKHWGLMRLSPTRKENRYKAGVEFRKNVSVLKAAAALEPELAVRLRKPLATHEQQRMRRKLEAARQLLNWQQGQGGLAAAAAARAGSAAGGPLFGAAGSSTARSGHQT